MISKVFLSDGFGDCRVRLRRTGNDIWLNIIPVSRKDKNKPRWKSTGVVCLFVRSKFYFAYSTERYSRITVTLI